MATGSKDELEPISTSRTRLIKCVVWDLDETLWKGVLSEGDDVVLTEGIVSIIQALDQRGILHSIASKNELSGVMAKLDQFGLTNYFLYPQVSWNSKAESIKNIAQALNIGIDAIAFVDDQAIERDEVRFSHPDVLCLDAADIPWMLDMAELTPLIGSADGGERRLRYLSDMQRQRAEEEFVGPQEEFVKTLGMRFRIFHPEGRDLARAEELTVRTHQLNTTGYTYSLEELQRLRESGDHLLLMAALRDRYGDYGTIGLSLIECLETSWTIKLLLMSCRVISRGVGSVLIGHIAREAKRTRVPLYAEFIPNGRNRMMYITYRLAGFREVSKNGSLSLLENRLEEIPQFPTYLEVEI